MSLGASLVLFAIGAILTWGVTFQAQGVDLEAIGVILMVVGAIGGLISMAFLYSWSPWPYRRTVVDRGHSHGDVVEDHVHERRYS
jgi:hypothetical protein